MSDTTEYKGLTIRIEHDPDCSDPLECDEGVFITYRKGARETLGNTPLDQEEHEEIAKRIASGELIGLAVYAYIHSGIALRTSAFGDPWDSGQSGFVYITKQTALEWQGGKIVTKARRELCLEGLASVVENYGQWLNGECYGYVIADAQDDALDSCWGFIGYQYAEEEAKRAADFYVKEAAEAKRTAWRAALHEARERRYWAARDVLTVTA